MNAHNIGWQGDLPSPKSGKEASMSVKGMQLTIKSVTPFAFAKAAPLLLAADPKC
jgi:hypothetical protein